MLSKDKIRRIIKKREDKIKRENAPLHIRSGWSCYETYLKSSLWAYVKQKVLSLRPKCECCPGKSQFVMHLVYNTSTIYGKRTDRMVALCCNCYEKAAYGKNDEKLTLNQSANKLTSMLKKADAWEWRAGSIREGANRAFPGFTMNEKSNKRRAFRKGPTMSQEARDRLALAAVKKR